MPNFKSMSIFVPIKQNLFLFYISLNCDVIYLNDILGSSIQSTYNKTNGIIGFLRSICIRNINIFSKFQNLTFCPFFGLNLISIFNDKIRFNGITVLFEFNVEIGP